jgi:hypothetical protein
MLQVHHSSFIYAHSSLVENVDTLSSFPENKNIQIVRRRMSCKSNIQTSIPDDNGISLDGTTLLIKINECKH